MEDFKSKEYTWLFEEKISQLNSLTSDASKFASAEDAIIAIRLIVDRLMALVPNIKVATDEEREMSLDIIETSPLVEFFWDVQNWWKVRKVTSNVVNLLWYTDEEFYNWSVSYTKIIHPDDLDRVLEEVNNHSKQREETFDQEYRLIKKDGTSIMTFDRTLIKYDSEWKIKYYYWYIMDISDMVEAKKQLENALYTDMKTWKPNLRAFIRDIEMVSHDWIILIKIEGLPQMNSLYWYEEVDSIIKNLIHIIWLCARSIFNIDTIYKIWDAELWIILRKGSNIEKVMRFVSFNKSVLWKWKSWIEIPIHLNFWYSEPNTDQYNSWLLSLYESRNRGKLVPYDKWIEEKHKNEAAENIDCMLRVREAIEKKEIQAFFQWLRDNKTGTINKYESLVRIVNQKGAIINPWDFISRIKWTEQMWKISMIMVENVIKALAYNLDSTIWVNLTWEDLENTDMIKFIVESMMRSWIPFERLTIEMLEDTVWNNTTILTNIKLLRLYGIKIAIDDFWTWYSNFWRLIELKPDYIKIDWSLIKWCSQDENKKAILKSLVHITWSKVIAEFVDNQEDQDYLIEIGVEYSQWYLFSKPMPVDGNWKL